MDILYLLIPLSAVLVLAIIGLFGWALHRGQFDDLEREGWRVLEEPQGPAGVAPAPPFPAPSESSNNLDDAQPSPDRPFRE